jgi:hypothetical protein
VIFRHPPPPTKPSRLPPPFRQAERTHFGDLTLIRYVSPVGLKISRRKLTHFRTGFPNNGAYVEGPTAEAGFGVVGSTIPSGA